MIVRKKKKKGKLENEEESDLAQSLEEVIKCARHHTNTISNKMPLMDISLPFTYLFILFIQTFMFME